MHVTILAVTDNDKQFAEPIQEYSKRLQKSVTIKTIKPIKQGETEQIIAKETALLHEKATALQQKNTYHTVLLSHRGGSLLSEQFATMHKKHPAVMYLIGWPYGVDESVLEPIINTKISFGKQTMPHGLVKLVLLEQIRRVQTILINKKYHY